jgi:hypothetical protein
MTTIATLTLLVLGVFLIYSVLGPVALNVGRFLKRAWLYCPEHQEYARVGVHPFGAALTAAYGGPTLHVRRCSLLKGGEVCDEKCLAGADF